MAKLVSGQVPEGEGHNYHNRVLDTYIIVISKSNMFKGSTALADQTLYEVDVAPTVQQTKAIYPGNKMYWKFFELEKFAAHKDSQNITKASPLKLQWLDFLLSCSAQTDIPEDRDSIIQECYNIMDKMKWDPDERTIHWKNIINQQDGEKLLSDTRVEGRLEGRVEGKLEGRVEGIKIGEVKAKVKLLPGIKVAIEKGMDSSLIKTVFPTFEESDLTIVKQYISDNPNCTNDDLANHIGLIGSSLENPIDH